MPRPVVAIEFREGDMFASGAAVFVNAVNCVGVMGKGVALQFKHRFPHYYAAYLSACLGGLIRPGDAWLCPSISGEPTIISIATKNHWRDPSQIDWVRMGAARLADHLRELRPVSIAVPALGCGNGGLAWEDVVPVLCAALADTGTTPVLLYPPGAPHAAGRFRP